MHFFYERASGRRRGGLGGLTGAAEYLNRQDTCRRTLCREHLMVGLAGTDWVALQTLTRLKVRGGGGLRLSRSLPFTKRGAPPYVPRRLTSRVAAVGVHEGVRHPLVLLESALLRHAAVDGAQLATLLLPVGHGRLVYCHFFPTVGDAAGEREEERTGRKQEAGNDKKQERTAEGKTEGREGKGRKGRGGQNKRKAGKVIRREIGPRWGKYKRLQDTDKEKNWTNGGVGEGGCREVAIR